MFLNIALILLLATVTRTWAFVPDGQWYALHPAVLSKWDQEKMKTKQDNLRVYYSSGKTEDQRKWYRNALEAVRRAENKGKASLRSYEQSRPGSEEARYSWKAFRSADSMLRRQALRSHTLHEILSGKGALEAPSRPGQAVEAKA
jgi:hypothetical protein